MARVVDFHGHWFPPEIVTARPTGPVGAIARAWPLLIDIDAQLSCAEAAGIDLKVVCAPLSSIAGSSRGSRDDVPARTNDALAEGVRRRSGAFVALATVDAFAGDAGAEEARRAVDELGLPGLVVDATDGQRTLADDVARPTLAFAAARRIPVFAHPVTPADLGRRFLDASAAGVLLARGTESALSTMALLERGVPAQLPGLQLVIAGIALAAVAFTPFLETPQTDGAVAALRRALYVDTMGFDPPTIRYLVEAVGADHVLAGSDWPIMWRDASRDRVTEVLDSAGLDDASAELVAGGNARRLLGGVGASSVR